MIIVRKKFRANFAKYGDDPPLRKARPPPCQTWQATLCQYVWIDQPITTLQDELDDWSEYNIKWIKKLLNLYMIVCTNSSFLKTFLIKVKIGINNNNTFMSES